MQGVNDMNRRNLRIVDADGHVVEDDRLIIDFLEEPYRGSSMVTRFPLFPTLDGMQRGAIAARLGITNVDEYRPSAWIDFLDEVGIESTVLYPTAGLSFGLIQDPGWAVSLARGYNQWFYETHHRFSSRLRQVALVPLQDVPAAVKETHRAVTELNAAGLLLPATGGDLGIRKPLGHPDFWPIYEAAQELNVPVAVHGAPGQGLGMNFFTNFASIQSLEHPLPLMVQLTSMVFEGVFERFPQLRVAFLEAGVGWVPYMMDRLDRSYDIWAGRGVSEFSEWVKKRPSEYITNGNVYFSAEGDEEGIAYAIKRIGGNAVLYASDFPHETNAQRAIHEIDELLEREAELPEGAIQSILADNVDRFYGLGVPAASS
jgi:predicted TIM-barrel fold metal-dependent hydrolase